MKVTISPEAAPPYTPPPETSRAPKYEFPKDRRPTFKIIAAILIILIGGGAIYYFATSYHGSTSTTTVITATTTVPTTKAGYLSACQPITQSGSYYLSGSVKYTGTSGACFNITASNVAIVCNGMNITGSGPYNGVGPFSYGVFVKGVNNFSVSNCGIANFSYGIYSSSVNRFRISSSNITQDYVSALYLSQSTNGTVIDNLITNSSSLAGAIYIANGSENNQFQNNTLKFNSVYGIRSNSSSNKFIDNYITGSSYSFICSAQNGYAFSSFAEGNTCFNETGCDFVACTGVNIPANLSQISLNSTVSSCGTIRTAGSYSLSKDINMGTYSSVGVSYTAPCITIETQGATLQCNGHKITNADTGISVLAQNVRVLNCSVQNSGTGVLLDYANDSVLANSTFMNDNVSIELVNSSGVKLAYVNADNSTYGMLYETAFSDIATNFSADNNKFGIYLSNSLGNIFTTGSALSNTKFDVFGDSLSTGPSSDIMTGVNCNITNAEWATCKTYVPGNALAQFPLTSCTNIQRSGIYVLSNPIINAPDYCFRINADDVVLKCDGQVISAALGGFGPAMYVKGRNNVTLENCGLTGFDFGVNVTNSTDITVQNINGSSLNNYGIVFKNVVKGTLYNNTIANDRNASIYLNNSRLINAYNNSAIHGIAQNIGLLLLNTSASVIMNNSGDNNYVGIELLGQKTANNTVLYNTYENSGLTDYSCDQYNNALNAPEKGGINYGSTETGCLWLAVAAPGAIPLQCTTALQPSLFTMSQDYAYGLGQTCFRIYANSTTINCNGHTVLSTDGGTFAYLGYSPQMSTIENCALKGFTTPIAGINSSVALINDTIYINTTGLPSSVAAVNITHTLNFQMVGTSIDTYYTGLSLYNVTYGKMDNDNVTAAISYMLRNMTALSVTNVTSTKTSGIGMYLENSTLNDLQNNYLYGGSIGLLCTGISISSINNSDVGGNLCSSNHGCDWIMQSASTCH